MDVQHNGQVLDVNENNSSHTIVRDIKIPFIISAIVATLCIIAYISHKILASRRMDRLQSPSSPTGTPVADMDILPRYTPPPRYGSSGTFRRGISRVGALARVDSFSGYQFKAGVLSACKAVAHAFGSLRRFRRRSHSSFSEPSAGRRNVRGRTASLSWDPFREEQVSSPPLAHVTPHHVEVRVVTSVELGALERADGEPPDR